MEYTEKLINELMEQPMLTITTTNNCKLSCLYMVFRDGYCYLDDLCGFPATDIARIEPD